MDIKKRIASNIALYCQVRGITYTELSIRVGVANQTASCWARGKKTPRMDKLVKICNILDCTLGEMIDSEQTIDTIRSSDAVKKTFKLMEKMTTEGVEMVSDYCELIYPKFKR